VFFFFNRMNLSLLSPCESSYSLAQFVCASFRSYYRVSYGLRLWNVSGNREGS
jgi:hypothetical protein